MHGWRRLGLRLLAVRTGLGFLLGRGFGLLLLDGLLLGDYIGTGVHGHGGSARQWPGCWVDAGGLRSAWRRGWWRQFWDVRKWRFRAILQPVFHILLRGNNPRLRG